MAQNYSGKAGRKAVCTFTVGDAMGESGGAITKQNHVFYGQENIPVLGALVTTGTDGSLTTTDFYLFSTTKDGSNSVTTKTGQQWKTSVYGNMEYAEAKTQEIVTVNAKGLIIAKTDQSSAYAYEYNAEGLLAKENVTVLSSGAFSKTIAYEYDDKGNITKKTTYSRKTKTDPATEYVSSEEIYSYLNGELVEILKYNGTSTSAPKLYSRKTYEVYKENKNQILEKSYTSPKVAADGTVTWSQSATAIIYEYANFTENGGEGWKISDLSTICSGSKNDVTVTFSAPKNAGANTKYAIFRSGQLAAIVRNSEVNKGGKCQYIDAGVQLGTWTYFVLPFEGDALTNITANGERYVSNTSNVTVTSDSLKPVQSISLKVNKDAEGIYIITASWDENPSLASSSCQKHSIYHMRTLTTGTKSPLLLGSTTDKNATSISFDYPTSYDVLDLFVATLYSEGVAISEHISLKKADLASLIATEPEEPGTDPGTTERTPFTVYGVYPYWEGAKTASFDIAKVNADTPAEVTTEVAISGINDMLACGATIGDKYYAFFTDVDWNVYFGTVNFATGNVVKLKKYGYGNLGYQMKALAYDAAYKTLYGIEQIYDEANDAMVTALCTIDPENGNVTEVKRYNKEFAMLAGDGNGTLYAISTAYDENFQLIPSLWKINDALELSADPVITTTAPMTYAMNLSSLVSPDAKVVYTVAGTDVYSWDLTAKTYEKLGSLSKEMAGITTAMGTADAEGGLVPEVVNTRFLVKKTWYGDSMGSVQDKDMRIEEYFYNYDGKVARIAQSARGISEQGKPTDYEITRLTKNYFDFNGNIISASVNQYGKYDFQDMAFRETGKNTYEYNEQGQLVKEFVNGVITEYTYNADGYVAEKKISTQYAINGSEPKWIQTIKNEEFNSLGLPTYFTSEGAYDSYNYVGAIEYNEKGEKTLEVHSKVIIDEEFGTPMMMPFEVEEHLFDETGFLTSKTNYIYDDQGQAIPQMRTSYSMVDGNPDKVKSVDETYNDGKWYSQAGSTCIYEYVDFNGMLDLVRLDAAATADETTPSKVNIRFSMPPFAEYGGGSVALYRDGVQIATKSFMDVFDFDTYSCLMTDENVKNGTHDYFVQPLMEQYSEMGDLLGSTGYYISEPSTVEVNTYLPAVSDLRLVSARKETEKNETKQIVEIGWTNPADRPDELFKSNEVIITGNQATDAITTDPSATALDMEVILKKNIAPKVSLFVLTRYTLGNVQSEPIEITLEDFNTAVGINNVAIDGEGNAFNFTNNVFSVSGTADITVFSAGSALLKKVENAESVDLNGLGSGTYVVVVKKGNAVKGYKVTIK